MLTDSENPRARLLKSVKNIVCLKSIGSVFGKVYTERRSLRSYRIFCGKKNGGVQFFLLGVVKSRLKLSTVKCNS